MSEAFMNIGTFAARIGKSIHTIRRNPAAYFMFKVGGNWKANENSVKQFEQLPSDGNNAIRLAIAERKENSQCRYTKEAKRIGSTYQRQMAAELGDLLAPKKRQKPSSYMTS